MPEMMKKVKQWNVTALDGFESLKLSEQTLPPLGDGQVLVKFHAASINYRDLIITHGKYGFPMKTGVVPGSDGAGEVVATGKHVTRFRPGDKVITLFNQDHVGGELDERGLHSGLGGSVDGTLRTMGAFSEHGLARMPETLSFAEAATLPCAGLTAWNALFGLLDKKLTAGQWVLTQGTGGVSVFAVQFAKAAGARVIATTSSDEKAGLLRKLGADHIINYKDNADWGTKAKEITGGAGVDHVVEVAGPTSMAQSLKAIRIGGVITIIGFVGGFTKDSPGFLDCLQNLCTTRGILVGSRGQLEDMCRAIDANPDKLRPVTDAKKFKLEDLKEAYQHQWDGKHQGKVVVEIS